MSYVNKLTFWIDSTSVEKALLLVSHSLYNKLKKKNFIISKKLATFVFSIMPIQNMKDVLFHHSYF